MTEISGPLTLVTEDAAVVTSVWVQAPALRPHGEGAILPQRARATITTGSEVSFSCAPGPAVLIWQAGGVEDQVPILVDDVPSQSLAEVVTAARLAGGRTADELAAMVREVASGVAAVTSGVAAVTAAASSASWDGDRLTVLGATSPPLTGEPGEPGAVPVIGANGTWWVDGVDTGVTAQGPPGAAGDGTGDVLWSELTPVLDGKADVGHTHSQYATTTTVTSVSSRVTTVEDDLEMTMTGLDQTMPMILDSLPIIVSSLPASPMPGRIYFVTG